MSKSAEIKSLKRVLSVQGQMSNTGITEYTRILGQSINQLYLTTILQVGKPIMVGILQHITYIHITYMQL